MNGTPMKMMFIKILAGGISWILPRPLYHVRSELQPLNIKKITFKTLIKNSFSIKRQKEERCTKVSTYPICANFVYCSIDPTEEFLEKF